MAAAFENSQIAVSMIDVKQWRMGKFGPVNQPVNRWLALILIAASSLITIWLIWLLSADVERLHQMEIASAYAVPQRIPRPKLRVSVPTEVRGLYWTAYSASRDGGQELLNYMKTTGLNTAVIDIKTDDGVLAFAPKYEELGTYTSREPLISDLSKLLKNLGEQGIYRIARIAVMRDDMFALRHPELALRDSQGRTWRDSLGLLWVDPAAPEVREYAAQLGREAWRQGFDEVQFDYVRFPSDGDLDEVVYPVFATSGKDQVEVMRDFFQELSVSLRDLPVKISYDLFGMTFVSQDDFGIGQRLSDVFPYADFVSPMVYPSHYSPNFKGFANPAEHPYEVVNWSLEDGVSQQLAADATLSETQVRSKVRPWLQDFDLGAVYTADKIEAQIRAARDAGASGWLLWNARNVYEEAEYE